MDVLSWGEAGNSLAVCEKPLCVGVQQISVHQPRLLQPPEATNSSLSPCYLCVLSWLSAARVAQLLLI